jgi:alcohol dehydrogenase class IV
MFSYSVLSKKYQRLETELVGEEQSTEKSIADMATRMEELVAKVDASSKRLKAKIDASQSRLEAMFQQLMTARTPVYCTPLSPQETTFLQLACCYQFWLTSPGVHRRRRRSGALN